MTQTTSDYILKHRLGRKYGFGAVALLWAGAASYFMGDSADLIAFKTLLAVPFGVILVWLPAIFDPLRSTTPFTLSFLERGALESLLLSIALHMVLWSPARSASALLIGVAISTIVVFACRCLGLWFFSRRR